MRPLIELVCWCGVLDAYVKIVFLANKWKLLRVPPMSNPIRFYY